MTEQSFTTELLKWAKTYGWRCFHVRNSGHAGMTAVQGDKGFPDLLCVKGSRWLVAELKVGKTGTKRGDATSDQIAWLKVLGAVGAEWHVWRPEDWSSILAVLSGR